MKCIIKNAGLFLTIVYVFSGCVTLKPDSFGVSKPDYNQRVVIQDAHFDQVLSPAGYGSFAAATLAGGYAGYRSDLIRYNSGGDQKVFKAGNALVGAALGFSATYFVNRALGWGKTKYVPDQDLWIRKTDNKYIRVKTVDATPSKAMAEFVVIPKSAVSDYTIKDLTDARTYKGTFPRSAYVDQVFKTGVENLWRSDLPELIELFPESKNLPQAKIKYVQTSLNYSDICQGMEKYPGLDYDFEPYFLKLIRNTENGIEFKNRFSASENFKKAYFNSYLTQAQSLDDFKLLDRNYQPILGSITKETILQEPDEIRRNLFDRKFKEEKFSDATKIDDFYRQFSWLDYMEKGPDLVSNYFQVADKMYEDGDFVLWMLRQLPDRQKHPFLPVVSKSVVESFIGKKLAEEVKSKVRIVSDYYTSNTNPEWEKWKSNNTYTAGLVAEKGALFLLYGQIENSGKYSVPVKVSAKADLFYTGEMQGTGPFTNFMIGAAKLLSGVKNITWPAGSQSGEYLIPALPARSRSSYSILLNFESNHKNLGINFYDLIKYEQEADLKSTDLQLYYLDYTPSASLLNLQMATQNMVKNGLPKGITVDLLRGEELKDQKWREDWQEILEARYRRQREYDQRRNMAVATGRCWEFEESEEITYRGEKYMANVYKDLVNNRYVTVFFFPGDDDDEPGWYEYDEGIIFNDDLLSKSRTEAELLNKIMDCK
jgi:hypothetical protein